MPKDNILSVLLRGMGQTAASYPGFKDNEAERKRIEQQQAFQNLMAKMGLADRNRGHDLEEKRLDFEMNKPPKVEPVKTYEPSETEQKISYLMKLGLSQDQALKLAFPQSVEKPVKPDKPVFSGGDYLDIVTNFAKRPTSEKKDVMGNTSFTYPPISEATARADSTITGLMNLINGNQSGGMDTGGLNPDELKELEMRRNLKKRMSIAR
jgi:hypothetical protein